MGKLQKISDKLHGRNGLALFPDDITEDMRRKEALAKHTRIKVDGAKKGFGLVKLLDNKTEIPVNFHNAQVKANKLGGWEITCPSCGEKQVLSESEIRNAGMDIVGRPPEPSAFETVAHGLSFVRQWNSAMQAAENESVDYLEWRLMVACALLDKNAWSFQLSTSAVTDLKLKCGCSVTVSFGENVDIVKECDRVAAFLKLGIKGEKSFRWMKYIFAPDGPSKVGEKKAAELEAFLRQTQNEKDRIQQLSEKLIAEIKKSKPFFYGDFSKVASLIEVARDNDLRLLTEAQKEKLDELDRALLRIANRPMVR